MGWPGLFFQEVTLTTQLQTIASKLPHIYPVEEGTDDKAEAIFLI